MPGALPVPLAAVQYCYKRKPCVQEMASLLHGSLQAAPALLHAPKNQTLSAPAGLWITTLRSPPSASCCSWALPTMCWTSPGVSSSRCPVSPACRSSSRTAVARVRDAGGVLACVAASAAAAAAVLAGRCRGAGAAAPSAACLKAPLCYSYRLLCSCVAGVVVPKLLRGWMGLPGYLELGVLYKVGRA